MKKQFLYLALILSAWITNAQTFINNEITYTILGDGTSVELSSGESFSGDLIIHNPITDPNSGNSYTVTQVADNAFYDNSLITSIDISSVTSIGKQAFFSCDALKQINLPLVITIDENAFRHCHALETINIPIVNTLGESAFQFCIALESINFPLATVINTYAFANCLSLTIVDIPLVSTIEGSLFHACTSLSSVNAISAITVEDRAFNGCENLTSITIPNVTSINNSAFRHCSSLSNINIPLVTTIGDAAFFNNALTEINLPEIASIGNSAFRNCTALNNVSIGNKIDLIDEHAFDNTIINTFAIDKATPVTIGLNVFEEVNLPNATLLVPQGSEEIYANYFVWELFGNISGATLSTADFKDFSNNINILLNSIDNTLEIDTSKKIRTISLYNLSGQRIAFSTTNSLDISRTSSGIMILHITLDQGAFSKKIVIQ